jgi:SAM-dependent methyltransferase
MSLLPLLYHTHHNLFAQDTPFWIALVEKYGAPVLELGCGTGRILLKLAGKGLPTFGLDHDPDMLAFLINQVEPGNSQNPGIFLADMTAFRLDYKFPLIIMPCNTLSSLTDHQRSLTLKLVQNHLAPQGVFAAALPNPNVLKELEYQGETEVEEVFSDPVTGKPVQVSSQWVKDKNAFHLQWNYDILEPDGSCQRLRINTSHSLDSLSSYLADISNAGLVVVGLYGDADFSPFEDDSEEVFIIAENRFNL